MSEFDPSAYTHEEQDLLKQLPAHIGFVVMIAEQTRGRGQREEIRELRAAATTIAMQYPDNALVQWVSPQAANLVQSDALVRHSRDKNVGAVLEAIVLECVQAAAILAAKSTPSEAEGYKQFALGVGQQVAEAHADAEFFGIGGQTVSRNERKVLARLREALEVMDIDRGR